MILKRKLEPEVWYKYLHSIDKDNYAICIHKIVWDKTYRLVCDYYDREWLTDEILYLGEWEWIEAIPAYEITDWPTLKWFYVVRNN